MKEKQKDLFNNEVKQEWEKHWMEMPEFKSEDKLAFKSIIVNFNNEEDIKQFSELIKQKVTLQTKYIWFPKKQNLKPSEYLYIYIKE